jgi:hypothetical protein
MPARPTAPPAPPPAPAPEESSVVRVEEPARPAARSTLSQVVEDYREARRWNGRDDRIALERWRALRLRWSHSELAQEIDLNLIETLVRLGRLDEARTEARRFAGRYPRSLRAAEMQALGAGRGVVPAAPTSR